MGHEFFRPSDSRSTKNTVWGQYAYWTPVEQKVAGVCRFPRQVQCSDHWVSSAKTSDQWIVQRAKSWRRTILLGFLVSGLEEAGKRIHDSDDYAFRVAGDKIVAFMKLPRGLGNVDAIEGEGWWILQ